MTGRDFLGPSEACGSVVGPATSVSQQGGASLSPAEWTSMATFQTGMKIYEARVLSLLLGWEACSLTLPDKVECPETLRTHGCGVLHSCLCAGVQGGEVEHPPQAWRFLSVWIFVPDGTECRSSLL